jgi:hypothetical protein
METKEKIFLKLKLNDELKDKIRQSIARGEKIDPSRAELAPEEIVIQLLGVHCSACACGKA